MSVKSELLQNENGARQALYREIEPRNVQKETLDYLLFSHLLDCVETSIFTI